eukprot:gene32092-39638_t
MKVDKQRFGDILKAKLDGRRVRSVSSLIDSDLQELIEECTEMADIPQDPYTQLMGTIQAMCTAWTQSKHTQNQDNIISMLVQSVVHGDLGLNSGSGVFFTRSPSTGTKKLFGEYHPNIDETTNYLDNLTLASSERIGIGGMQVLSLEEMEGIHPHVIADMTRASRTIRAAVQCAISMVSEHILTERDALLRIDPAALSYFQYPMIDSQYVDESHSFARSRVIGRGVATSDGAATGQVAFSARDVMECRQKGEACIWVKYEDSVEAVEGMELGGQDAEALQYAVGVMTLNGSTASRPSHILQSLNKSAVTNVSDLRVNTDRHKLHLHNATNTVSLHRGDVITIDGHSGLIYRGAVPTIAAGQDLQYHTVLSWMQKYRGNTTYQTKGLFGHHQEPPLNTAPPPTPATPLTSLESHTVGVMIEAAIRTARLVNRHVEICAVGAHCDDISSAAYLATIGVNSLVCEQDRVVVAVKMACTQVAIRK